MNYIEDRKLKITLLTLAKHQLSDVYPFICDALVMSYCMQSNLKAQYGFLTLQAVVDELRAYIMKAIYPHKTYDQWVFQEHMHIARRSNHWDFQPGRLGRLAWIDWMIACYEEDIANAKGQE